jgi:hypothetical protein
VRVQATVNRIEITLRSLGGARPQEPEKKIEQPFGVKIFRDFLMPLAVYKLDVCLATHSLVATRKLQGVLLEGDNLISITVNVENGDLGSGQRG